MLNLVIFYLGLIFNLAFGSFLVYMQNYKCLGMQTLYDCVLTNVLKATMLCFCCLAFLYTLATFVSHLHPYLSAMIVVLLYFPSVYCGLSLAAVAVIRYLLVFHGKLFYIVQDEEVMFIVKTLCSVLGIAITLTDYLFFNNVELDTFYQLLALGGSLDDAPGGPPHCIKFAFSVAALAFLILLVCLEILNYKYGEGFVQQWKRWWNDSHQDETNENEEFGINFIRIVTIMITLCFVFFFSSSVIYFGKQPFFGFPNVAQPSQVIQVFIIDMLWAAIVIQNPLFRKRFISLITGRDETVQIIRIWIHIFCCSFSAHWQS